jgi:phosphate transport system substrate-binding protein
MITGWVSIHGNNYLVDGSLGEFWEKGFQKFHPMARVTWFLPTSASAFAALYYKQADLVMGHKPGFYDLLAYQRHLGYDPTEITAVTGSYDVAGWENSTVILVNDKNPLKGISVEEIDGIFGAARQGGWAGTNFRPDWKRGPEKNIRSWAQMGMTGPWAKQRITPYGFNVRYNTATDFADKYMQGGVEWNEEYRGFAHIVQANGKRYIQADQITDALAANPYGIAFNRYRGARKGVRPLPVSWKKGGPYVAHTLENVQNRTYPLFNEFYFYTSVAPGTKPPAIVREFIRYILSREGQEEVQRDGKYLPLTPEVVEAQLAKLKAWDAE